jgi:uncharacterized protein involved in response to NO
VHSRLRQPPREIATGRNLIGGRIVPSFTHNWLARRGSSGLPQSFSRFDALVLSVAAIALLVWIVRPISPVAGALLVTAGLFHLGRLARRAGERTLADRLVSDPACGICVRSRGLSPDGHCGDPPEFLPMSAGIHAWTVGAVGVMTLAVMTRAYRLGPHRLAQPKSSTRLSSSQQVCAWPQ